MLKDNIFQKILDKQIPANIVYEDDRCLAFRVSPVELVRNYVGCFRIATDRDAERFTDGVEHSIGFSPQFFERARVLDDVVGECALFGERKLGSDARANGFLVEAIALAGAFDLSRFVARDDDERPHLRSQADFDEQGRFVAGEGLTARGELVEAPLLKRADQRVEQAFEASARGFIRKHEASEELSIERAVLVENLRSERLDDFSEPFGSRLDDLPRKDVGFDDRHAALPEPSDHRALSRREAAREAEDVHDQ
jgi:hypothetical protein